MAVCWSRGQNKKNERERKKKRKKQRDENGGWEYCHRSRELVPRACAGAFTIFSERRANGSGEHIAWHRMVFFTLRNALHPRPPTPAWPRPIRSSETWPSYRLKNAYENPSVFAGRRSWRVNERGRPGQFRQLGSASRSRGGSAIHRVSNITPVYLCRP